jgi:hypothetical protein
MVFEPKSLGTQNCTDPVVTGTPSARFDFIQKFSTNDELDPEPIGGFEPCTPYYYGNAQINTLQVNTAITPIPACGEAGVTVYTGASITLSGNVTANTGTFTVKPFNIPHPTKEGKRLVHACLEGPENGVYYRGTMRDSNVINLPDYWEGLVDIDSITVHLTPIGVWQDLYVEKINWGKQVIVKSASGGPVNAYYTVNATRKDVAPLPIEMDEGEKWPYND